MDSDFSQNNKYTKKFVPTIDTLGVERELRRFAMNEYLKKKDDTILIGTNDGVVDEDTPTDDLLLTNAVTENTVQDELDKTRYLKETKSYVTIHSAARNTTATDITTETGETLFSTGSTYTITYPFAPYPVVVDSNGDPIVVDENYFVALSSRNNHIQFKLQDWTNENAVQQVLTPEFTETFDVYLPSVGEMLSLDQLQVSLEANLNLVASKGSPLDNSSDKNHMYVVEVVHYDTINPDLASVNIKCQSNFRFTMTFFSFGDIETPPVAEPIDASDAAFVVQNPIAVFPLPNSYALDLNKTYIFVKAIRVVSSEIPNTDTIINTNNNHITFQLIDKSLPPKDDDPEAQNIKTKSGSINWEIYIPYGNYTLIQLLDQIETQINNMLLGEVELTNIFSMSGSDVTGVVEINVIDPYVFKWDFNAMVNLQWRNLHSMLGFKDSKMTLYSTKFTNTITKNMGTYTITCPYKAIMLKKSNIIWLQLNNYETVYDTYTKNSYFCRFNLDNVNDNQFAYDTFTPNVHVFVDSPLPVLGMVDVRLYDELGMPYNFNGIDHSFTLELTHHIDRLMGTDYSSKRGVNDKSSYI